MPTFVQHTNSRTIHPGGGQKSMLHPSYVLTSRLASVEALPVEDTNHNEVFYESMWRKLWNKGRYACWPAMSLVLSLRAPYNFALEFGRAAGQQVWRSRGRNLWLRIRANARAAWFLLLPGSR